LSAAGAGPLPPPGHIGNGLLWRYEHDLILSDEEFEYFDLRDLVDHQQRKTYSSTSGGIFSPLLAQLSGSPDLPARPLRFLSVSLIVVAKLAICRRMETRNVSSAR
jgi:hypothetical protein